MNEAHPQPDPVLRPGKETSEFRLSVIFSIITAVIGAVLPILITLGTITPDQGGAIIDVVAAIGALLAVIIPGWIVTNYAKQRTALKKRIAATQKNQ